MPSGDFDARGRVTVAFFARGLAAIVGLHPKHAEAGCFDRAVERGGNPQRQDLARIGGIDDAVVPQARTRVVRMSFALVLRADRSLERALLLGAPRAAFGVDRIAPYGREHGRRLFTAQ